MPTRAFVFGSSLPWAERLEGWDPFRTLVAGALVIHFSIHLFQTVPWLLDHALYSAFPIEGRIHQRTSIVGSGLNAGILRSIFGCGAILALGLMLGGASRLLSLILLVFSLATYWAIFPIAYIDDYMANASALLLSLMPSTSRQDSRRHKVSRSTSNWSNGVPYAILLWASVIYLTGGFGYFSDSSWPFPISISAVFRFIPVAYVLPGFRIVGLLAQVVTHGYLIGVGGTPVTQLTLAATAPLFLGLWSRHSRVETVDAGTVVAATCLTMSALLFGGSAFGISLPGFGQLLSDVGLLPYPAVFRAPIASPLFLRFAGSNSTQIDRSAIRDRVATSRMAEMGPDSPLMPQIATAVARRVCRESSRHGIRTELSWNSGPDAEPWLQFECDANGVPLFRR